MIESSHKENELQLFYDTLVEGINKDILGKGSYQGEFTSGEIKKLIEIALLQVLQGEKAQEHRAKAVISQTEVAIKNGTLRFRGKFGLITPVKINFETDFTLTNNPSESQNTPIHQLQLEKPSNPKGWIIFIDRDDPESAYALGDLAPLGITLDQINAQAKLYLGNPNQLILGIISFLVPKEIQLDPQSISLHITPQNTIQLKLATRK